MQLRTDICAVIFFIVFGFGQLEVTLFGRQKASISKIFLTKHNIMRNGPPVSRSAEQDRADREEYLRQKTQSHTVEINLDLNNWTTYVEDWEPSLLDFELTPNPDSCLHRPVHWLINGRYHTPHVYANFSSLKQFQHPNGTAKLYTWLQAKNICRRYCMTLLGFEMEYEWEMIKIRTRNDSGALIWTSGRICDFSGCEGREYLKPLMVNGWSWSDTRVPLSPTNSTPKGWIRQPWYAGGYKYLGQQPDNLDRDVNGNGEQCIAVVKSPKLGDEPHWFDMVCSEKGHVICEESASLIQEAHKRWPEYNLTTSWPSL